jgi:hypothetical protein
MEHLYEISQEFVELQEAAKNCDDVDETMLQALEDTMEGIQLSFEEKAQNIVHVMNNVTAGVAAIDEQIDRLRKMKTTATNKQEWFRNYLRENMIKTGISKIECDFFKITLGKPVASVEITNELELPDDLIDVETKIKPKKAEIKKLLQNGEEVTGAVLKDGMYRLIIK